MDWTLLLVTMLLGLLNYILIDQAPEDVETPAVRAVLLFGWTAVSSASSLFVPAIYRLCREPMLPLVVYGVTLTLGHIAVRWGLYYCRAAAARRGQRAYAALMKEQGDMNGASANAANAANNAK